MRNLIKGDFDKDRNYDAVMKMVAEEEKEAMKRKPRKRMYASIGLVAACIMIAVFIGTLKDNGTIDKNRDKIYVNDVDIMGQAKLDADVEYEYGKKATEKIRGQEKLSFNLPDIQGMNQTGNWYIFTRQDNGVYNILHDQVYDFGTPSGDKKVRISLSDKGAPLRDYFFGSSGTPSKIEDAEPIIFGMEQSYYALFQIGNIYIDLETNGVSQNQMVEIIKDIITMNEA